MAAVRDAVEGETDLSTGTVQRLQRKVSKALVAAYGPDDAPAMPSQPTFYRLVKRLAEGRHTFGSARTRRSLSKQPDGPFGAITVARPGEVVEIDSTPLDVRVVLDDGLVDRVELLCHRIEAHFADRRGSAGAIEQWIYDEHLTAQAITGPSADRSHRSHQRPSLVRLRPARPDDPQQSRLQPVVGQTLVTH